MLTRRVPITVAIVLLLVGIAAGKAWAILDSGYQSVPAPTTTRSPATLIAPNPVGGIPVPLEEPSTTTTTIDPAWQQLVALATRIGRCEEPGSGEYGIDWTADGWTSAGHFAGGLGMRTDLYASLSGGHYAPNDSPEEQIRVFGLAWAQYGQRAWGCPGG